MRKVTRNLDLVNKRENTVFKWSVQAYLFTAKTSDNIDIPLYTYKESGKWEVNDDIGANALLVPTRSVRRVDAIEKATRLMSEQTEGIVTRQVEAIKQRKLRLTEGEDKNGNNNTK